MRQIARVGAEGLDRKPTARTTAKACSTLKLMVAPELERRIVKRKRASTGETLRSQEVIACSHQQWEQIKDSPRFANWTVLTFTLCVVLASPVSDGI